MMKQNQDEEEEELLTQHAVLTDELRKRRGQIKETKRSWASEEQEIIRSAETERRMKVQEGRREIVGDKCPPVVQH